MIERNLDIPQEQIADFCQRWHIREVALFGSVLRDDFASDSDLDIVVTFTPEADWSLFDHLLRRKVWTSKKQTRLQLNE